MGCCFSSSEKTTREHISIPRGHVGPYSSSSSSNTNQSMSERKYPSSFSTSSTYSSPTTRVIGDMPARLCYGTNQADPKRAQMPSNVTVSHDGRRIKHDSEVSHFSTWSRNSHIDDRASVMKGRGTDELNNVYAGTVFDRRTPTPSSVYSSGSRRTPTSSSVYSSHQGRPLQSHKRSDSAMSAGFGREYRGIIGTHPSLKSQG